MTNLGPTTENELPDKALATPFATDGFSATHSILIMNADSTGLIHNPVMQSDFFFFFFLKDL